MKIRSTDGNTHRYKSGGIDITVTPRSMEFSEQDARFIFGYFARHISSAVEQVEEKPKKVKMEAEP